MTRHAVVVVLARRTFSGLRSQWMMPARRSTTRHSRICRRAARGVAVGRAASRASAEMCQQACEGQQVWGARWAASAHLLDDDGDEREGEAAVVVPLEDLVEVGVQALKDDAEVARVHEVVEDADDVVLARGVVRLVEELEDAGLHDGLVEVGGLVLDHFDGHLEARLGRTERYLPERAAAEHRVHFVPAGRRRGGTGGSTVRGHREKARRR